MTGRVSRERLESPCPVGIVSTSCRQRWGLPGRVEMEVEVVKMCWTPRGVVRRRRGSDSARSIWSKPGRTAWPSRRIGGERDREWESPFVDIRKDERHEDVRRGSCLESERTGAWRRPKLRLRLSWKTYLSARWVGLEVGCWRCRSPPWYCWCDRGFRMSWGVRWERQELSWQLRCRVNREKVPRLSAEAIPRGWRMDAWPGLSSAWTGAKFFEGENCWGKPVCWVRPRFGRSQCV